MSGAGPKRPALRRAPCWPDCTPQAPALTSPHRPAQTLCSPATRGAPPS